MARYIKANPKVAAYLHLENDRLKLKDGNYILWQGDMTAFAPLPMLNDTLTKIGAIALMPHEAKQEQDGTVVRPLPTATDERFIMETEKEQTKADTETAANDEQQNGDGNAPASAESETAVESETTVDGDGEEPQDDEKQTEASIDGQEEASSESQADSESEQTADETTKEE